MRAGFRLFLVVLCCSGTGLKAQSIVLEGVNLIPMTSEIVLYNQRVRVEQGKITAIGPMDEKPAQPAELHIDAKGKYLIPAFSDTHFHQHRNDIADTELLFKLLIANGVTSVRSMAQWNQQDTVAIRQLAAKPEVLAPYYYASGPQVNADNVKNVAEALAMADLHHQRGYDFIKVHGNLDQQAYLALLERAALYGIPVTGHAQRHLPLHYSLRMHSLAHMEELVVLLAGQHLQIPKVTPLQLSQMVEQIKQ